MKITYLCNQWILSTVVRPKAKIRLICFPYAGGSALAYKNWGEQFPESIEVVSVNLPGHGNRILEPAISDMDILIENLYHNLADYLMDKPIIFLGHSMGASVCFEFAKYLNATDVDLRGIFISAYKAPHLMNKSESDFEEKLYRLTDDQLVQKLKDIGGTPADLINHTELMKLALPTMRSELKLLETYKYRHCSPLDIPIIAFASIGDNVVDFMEVFEWNKHTTSSFKFYKLSGGHFFIHSAEKTVVSIVIKEIMNVFKTTTINLQLDFVNERRA